jgi:hypothetical protein
MIFVILEGNLQIDLTCFLTRVNIILKIKDRANRYVGVLGKNSQPVKSTSDLDGQYGKKLLM